MQVSIKRLDVQMELKNKGMEIDVYKPDGTFLGDLVITKTGLTWCKGKTKAQNGVKVKWGDFITWMENDD